MRIAITGGRYRPGTKEELIPSREQMIAFRDLLKHLAGSLWEVEPHDGRCHIVIHGAARGTDQYVGKQCERWGLEVEDYPVVPELDGPWPAAGHRRNRRMLEQSKAEVLVAFPGEKGTAGCVKIAGQMGLMIWQWEDMTADFEALAGQAGRAASRNVC